MSGTKNEGDIKEFEGERVIYLNESAFEGLAERVQVWAKAEE